MKNSKYLGFIGWVICVCVSALTPAQEVQTRQIRVIDPDGKPVSGAVADAWLINDQYFWPSTILKRVPVVTDAEGIAGVRYPGKADLGLVNLTVESVKLTVSHSDFCKLDVSVPTAANDSKPFDIKLTPGVSLKLSAVDEKGERLTEPFAVMSTGTRTSAAWKRPTPDKAECRSLEKGNHQVMLVQPRAEDRHWFSDVLAHHFDRTKEAEVVLEDIEMRPGVAIRGKFSANVPRPIKNGKVIASHVPLPAGESWDEKMPSLMYYSTVTVDPGGAFEFKSMPRTGTVQLIGLCDGWVGQFDDKAPFIVGESFDVDDEDLTVELKLQATFDARIRVVDKQGKPVKGAHVACSPNQLFKKGGSTILGESFDVMPMLKNQFSATPVAEFGDIRSNAFDVVTDEDGRAVLRNLPRNRWSESFSIWSTKESSKKVISTDNDNYEGKLPSANENEVEVELVVKTEDK